jgi:hypothetical protein
MNNFKCIYMYSYVFCTVSRVLVTIVTVIILERKRKLNLIIAFNCCDIHPLKYFKQQLTLFYNLTHLGTSTAMTLDARLAIIVSERKHYMRSVATCIPVYSTVDSDC